MLNFKTKKAAGKELLEQIFEKRPFLRKILEENGNKSLAKFAENNIKNCLLPDEGRKKEFLGVFEKILAKRLGTKVTSGVVAQLNKYYFGSTSEHHGPLNSNKFLTANLLLASGYSKFQDPILKYIPVLSCASISLNNEDFPRGLQIHRWSPEGFKSERLPFLPSALARHNCMVYNFRSYQLAEAKKMENALKGVAPEIMHKIRPILDMFERKEILEAPNLCHQITQVNFQLWREIFQKNPSIPDLIYVEMEELISSLLLEYHMEQDTLIHHMIFDQDYENKLLNQLVEAMGKFVRQGYLSTHLFWGISEQNYRLKLSKIGDELVSEDGSFKVALRPGDMAQALRGEKIMPNLLTIFSILHMYYGFNCIGGFNQIHYLDAMQKVYNDSGVDSIKSEANSRLYGYGPEILFLEENGGFEPAYAMDLRLYGQDNLWQWIKENFEKLTLNDAFGSAAEVINKVLNEK